MEGVIKMKLAGVAITAGLGAAMGAVAVLMMPRQNATRQLAQKAADKMEDAAFMAADAISSKMDMQ